MSLYLNQFAWWFLLTVIVSHDINAETNNESLKAASPQGHVNRVEKQLNPYEKDNKHIKKIFEKYGNGKQITFEGFEHLLESLGLEKSITDHNLSAHYKDESKTFQGTHADHRTHALKSDIMSFNASEHFFDSNNNSFISTEKDLQPNSTFIAVTNDSQVQSAKGNENKHTVLIVNKCLTASEILENFKIDRIDEIGFRKLCPTIIYELDQRSCKETSSTQLPEDHFSEKTTINTEQYKNMHSSFETWLFASVAVVAISLVGLMSILFIPLIQKNHHSDILQLLVGLAIGTLTSDALLHLLPHAFSTQMDQQEMEHRHEHGEDHHNHDSVWFGLMALVGIIGFLTFERVVTILSDLCNKTSRKTKIGNCNRAVGEKLSNHNLNSDPTSSPTELEKFNSETLKVNNEENHASVGEVIDVHCLSGAAAHEMKLTTEQCHRETIVYPHPDPDRGFVVQLTDHHHHHQRQTQRGAQSVIYMVITGDGLHNFCDGIAVGVAFAGGGLSGGISTTIAVLCHELPHEVGDFAVLLKAGLSVKRAITYNALSGFLCFAGMSIGVAVGKINDAWLSAAIAGMFLYIALVDMIPQLDCCPTQSGTTRAFKLTIQLIGISIGVAIMCMISIYESRIKLTFN